MDRAKRLRLLHVEDEPNARLMLEDLLGDEVELASAESAEAALALVAEQPFDLTLLDWMLPGASGGTFLQAVRTSGRAGKVVVLTAVGTMERALEALRGGAYDFLVKPADPDALLELVEKARRSLTLLDSAGRSRPRVEGGAAAGIKGTSGEVAALRTRLELVATSDVPVLIVGESGTGKELVARALHEASGRHRGRLVTLNCAAIPEALFESELFGHRRGAFTGASADRPGLVELAHQGTLFLDEIGELLPLAQAKLLRVLQEQRVRRVGDGEDRAVDVRVIAATNRDLEEEVDREAFREDLLYRLDVVRLEVPPLRERLGDLDELLDHFLATTAQAYARPVPDIGAAALAALRSYPWPGNIRELENTAKRIVLLGLDEAMRGLERRRLRRTSRSLRQAAEGATAAAGAAAGVRHLKDVVRDATRDAVLRALDAAGGSRTQAAELLGISRKTLFNKMQELGIAEQTQFE